MSGVDRLVEDYLRRLEWAAAALPPDPRSDLVQEIGEHIAAARAGGAGDDEAAVRTVLDRLGEPEEIVAAAREDVPSGWGPGAQPRGTGHELAAVLLLTAGSLVPVVGWLAGVVLLWTSSLWRVREKLLGTLVVPLGPGIALFGGPLLLFGRSETCTSTPGTSTELMAPPPPPDLVVPPPDPAAPQASPVEPSFPPAPPSDALPLPPLPESTPGMDVGITSCEVTGLSPWLAIPLTLLLVVAPVVVAVVLYRIARRRAGQAPPTPPGSAGSSPWGPLEVAAVVLLGVGGLVVPFVGAVVGLVLACASPRWTARDKGVVGVLALLPAALYATSFVLPTPAFSGPGGAEVLLLLVTGPVAAAYLAVMLTRRASAPASAASGWS